MFKKLSLIVLLSVIITGCTKESISMQEEFVDSIKEQVLENYNEKGGPLPSIVFAQGSLESSWGRSELTIDGKNLFGVKARDNEEYIEFYTHEFIDGKDITIKEKFKKYESLSESINDHCELLSTKYYREVLEAADYKEAARKLQELNYATDPRYAEKLIELIEENNFQRFD